MKKNVNVERKNKFQFLIGKVQQEDNNMNNFYKFTNNVFQFLIGKVQQAATGTDRKICQRFQFLIGKVQLSKIQEQEGETKNSFNSS